ncbi:MAG: Rpn family recombination-promoting nuclease/putative transposase [Chloroflexales bacterium]|nr:Rpn family recombination-promoting nuclease/putative transposase [Chloroflexales bacterium]
MTDTVANPHDAVFTHYLSEPTAAVAVLRQHLPAAVRGGPHPWSERGLLHPGAIGSPSRLVGEGARGEGKRHCSLLQTAGPDVGALWARL